MKIERKNLVISNNNVVIEVAHFDNEDSINFQRLFKIWTRLNSGLGKYGRKVNIPEVLSEGMFCLFSGSVRYQKKISGKGSVSFDTINLTTNEREQIKASSIEEDLTSFGPKSEWDKLYFMSFYNQGNIDGTFDVYEIPSELIYKNKVNRGQTMKKQQKEKRRPRFSIMKDIIEVYKLKPVGKNIKLWKS